MISEGIDVSKGKSTVCIMKLYGEIVRSPYEIIHTKEGLQELATLLLHLDEELKVVMEVTGTYHLPILMYLKEKGIFVSVVNPLILKKYANSSTMRKGKTDKLDSRKIAAYGLDNWYNLKEFDAGKTTYQELKLLSRQYSHYMQMRVASVQSLTSILDATMPGIKNVLRGWRPENGKDKLSDFVEEFWHYDLITNRTEKQFTANYMKWAEKKGYRKNQAKASEICALARNGIPTISSQSPVTKLLVQEAVHQAALESVIKGLQDKGYQIVPISQLIIQGEYTIDHEGRPRPCRYCGARVPPTLSHLGLSLHVFINI